jgi:hypothetical protein
VVTDEDVDDSSSSAMSDDDDDVQSSDGEVHFRGFSYNGGKSNNSVSHLKRKREGESVVENRSGVIEGVKRGKLVSQGKMMMVPSSDEVGTLLGKVVSVAGKNDAIRKESETSNPIPKGFLQDLVDRNVGEKVIRNECFKWSVNRYGVLKENVLESGKLTSEELSMMGAKNQEVSSRQLYISREF